MKRFVNRNIYFILAIPVFIFALSCEMFFFKKNSNRHEAERILNIFEKKEHKLGLTVDSVGFKLKSHPVTLNYWSLLPFLRSNEEGLEIAVYSLNSLVFWSSSSIILPPEIPKLNGIIHLPTGWYYQISKKSGVYTICGFVLIKREFPYHNRYIKSSFDRDFMLPDDYVVSQVRQPGSINVTRPDGKFLFSLNIPRDGFQTSGKSNSAALLYLVILFLVLAQINLSLKLNRRISDLVKFFISIGLQVFIYLVVVGLKIPDSLFQTKLFLPHDFAYSRWIASLGEFLLICVLMFSISISFFLVKKVRLNARLKKIWIYFVILFTAFYFSFSIALLRILLLNSNISMEFLGNLRFSAINVYAFTGISLQVLGFVIIMRYFKQEFFKQIGKFRFVRDFLVAGVISGIVVSFILTGIDWSPFLFYFLVILLLSFFESKKIIEYKYTFLLVLSVAGALYINFYAHDLIQIKKNKVLDLWAVKLSSERDSGAEIFLSELDSKLHEDTIIQSHLYPPYKTLESYFQNNYFTGFWRNYNLQITICNSEDSVYLTDDKRHYPCLEFFTNLRKSKGILVSGSNFYFMDRLNGRISYLGQLDVTNSMGVPVKIFIELNSKVIPEGKGYPELLLDEHASRESQDGDISYAKYFDGELVDRGGEYQYSMKLPQEVSVNQEFTHFVKNGYIHCSYHRYGNNYVIASYPQVYFYDKISTFPYLFLLFFLIGSILRIIGNKNFTLYKRHFDFRQKIQLTLILSLLGILIIIGLGLMFYNSNKLLLSVKDNLNEKLLSVTSELSMRIGLETELNGQMPDILNEQLIMLSDIIHTDINLYDLSGRLFSTSRTEIYDRGLMSRRMDPVAYQSIAIDHLPLFLHDENLGEMKFYSAYSPIYNQNNKLIGYVNLPYFNGQDEIEKQISDFIVAFSNLYILLIMMSLLLALIISHNLTAPLLQIENYLKGIQLGKTNAKIEYSGDDEIGRLAGEYNKKVEELAVSAELLARSERESAWQGMARQVAHEINNPLTPMKLSIQYLQRIKEQNSENFDDYFHRVSRTLVEQIDALSLIASSFSDFAKMPGVSDELIDLREKLKEVVLLFENSNNVSVTCTILAEGPVYITADKDQIGRAVINLVKNGIQAIPKDGNGFVKVVLSKEGEWARILITDNGSGIPSELHDKLFEPNFTTKSSGMGLGLAIVKKIIENSKGEIWFESTKDVETTFTIKLPLSAPV